MLPLLYRLLPYNGASSYKVDISKPVIDLAITSGASASDLLASKVTTLRLAGIAEAYFISM